MSGIKRKNKGNTESLEFTAEQGNVGEILFESEGFKMNGQVGTINKELDFNSTLIVDCRTSNFFNIEFMFFQKF